MDFKKDLRDFILAEFTRLSIVYNNPDLRILCIHYFNTLNKLIPVKPRSIIKSTEIIKKSKGASYLSALSTIEREFQNGYDLNPHLSRRFLDPDFDDSLLNDWLIHHIHISDTKANSTDYFFARSNNLLFALVNDYNVYFIDIRPHNENNVFAKRELLEIVDRNWSFIIEPFILKGVFDVAVNPTDAEIIKLRKSSTNVILKINGKVICSPGGGYTMSGDSVKSVNLTNVLLENINDWEKAVKEIVDRRGTITNNGTGDIIKHPDFKLELKGNQFRIKEIKTGIYTDQIKEFL